VASAKFHSSCRPASTIGLAEIENLSTDATLVSIGVALDHSKWLLGAVALSLTTRTRS
jgi:hypothetical protein